MGKFSLANITTDNNSSRGKLITVHSQGGIGKTTLGAEFCTKENGLMILGEDGLSPLGFEGVPRTPVITRWEDFQETIKQLVTEKHGFKTVVVDTVDNMTTLLDTYVVDTYYGGDQKAADSYKAKYSEMNKEFNGLLGGFDMLLDKGINVIALVHSIVDTHRAPDSEAYQHWSLNLPGGAKTSLANLLYDHSDFVLFGRRDVVVADGKGRGGQRVLMTEWDSAWSAKSRGKDIPGKIPFTYDGLKSIM